MWQSRCNEISLPQLLQWCLAAYKSFLHVQWRQPLCVSAPALRTLCLISIMWQIATPQECCAIQWNWFDIWHCYAAIYSVWSERRDCASYKWNCDPSVCKAVSLQRCNGWPSGQFHLQPLCLWLSLQLHCIFQPTAPVPLTVSAIALHLPALPCVAVEGHALSCWNLAALIEGCLVRVVHAVS